MFVLKNFTRRPNEIIVLNDIRDLGDVILNISDDPQLAKTAMYKAGEMHFNDSCEITKDITLSCVTEADLPNAIR